MRTKLFIAAVAVAWVGAFALTTFAHDDRDDGGDEARIRQGLRVSPVTLNYRKRDRDLVGLGSYLVNAAGACNDCHTNPSFVRGGDPFLGQPKLVNTAHFLAGGAQFGPFTSRNITPGNGLPETWEEFLGIMRTGDDPDHLHPQFGPKLQVMPWPVYQNMKEADLRAIYAYLNAIPPALPCAEVSPTSPDPTCRPSQP